MRDQNIATRRQFSQAPTARGSEPCGIAKRSFRCLCATNLCHERPVAHDCNNVTRTSSPCSRGKGYSPLPPCPRTFWRCGGFSLPRRVERLRRLAQVAGRAAPASRSGPAKITTARCCPVSTSRGVRGRGRRPRSSSRAGTRTEGRASRRARPRLSGCDYGPVALGCCARMSVSARLAAVRGRYSYVTMRSTTRSRTTGPPVSTMIP
jgi:hypothetical protein